MQPHASFVTDAHGRRDHLYRADQGVEADHRALAPRAPQGPEEKGRDARRAGAQVLATAPLARRAGPASRRQRRREAAQGGDHPGVRGGSPGGGDVQEPGRVDAQAVRRGGARAQLWGSDRVLRVKSCQR